MMSSPKDIPKEAPHSHGDHHPTTPKGHIVGSPKGHFLIPSPIPTRRNRTYSASERAAAGPSYTGTVKSFCREKGHGFIIPSDEDEELLFVHISDIDGEFVPKAGDEVTYKKVLIPPKMEKCQAVHVQIINLVAGETHERWDSPVHHSPSKTS